MRQAPTIPHHASPPRSSQESTAARPSVWRLLVAGLVDWTLALTLAVFVVFGLHLGPLGLVALSLPFIVGALTSRSPGGLVSGIAIVEETAAGRHLSPLRAVARVVVQLSLTLPAVSVTFAALMVDMAFLGSLAGALGAGWILDEEHMAWFVLPALAVTFGVAAAGEVIGRRIGGGRAPWDRVARSQVRRVRGG